MSLASLMFPASFGERRRRGRPKTADSSSERTKHLAVLKAHHFNFARTCDLATIYLVDVRTIRRWLKLAKSYPEGVRLLDSLKS